MFSLSFAIFHFLQMNFGDALCGFLAEIKSFSQVTYETVHKCKLYNKDIDYTKSFNQKKNNIWLTRRPYLVFKKRKSICKGGDYYHINEQKKLLFTCHMLKL